MSVKQELISTFFLLQIFCVFGVRISQQKCLQYQSLFPSNSNSGMELTASRIADPKEYPFMAKVYVGNSTDLYYNGMLISENFVVTIARNTKMNGTHVVLGDSVNKLYNGQKRLSVVQTFQIPRNEISLLKLNESITFDQYIRPVCLLQPESIISESLIEIGWTRRNGLRKEKWNLWSMKMCEHLDEYDETRVCANRDSWNCNDWDNTTTVEHLYAEGFALLNDHNHTSVMNELVGVKVRSSTFYCGSYYPQTFARMSVYIDWIEQIVWPSCSKATNISSTLHIKIVMLFAIFLARFGM